MNLKLVRKNNPESLVSTTAKSIPPSGIREFFDIVASMPDCISLGVGEPDFVTPWRISDMGIYAIKDGYTHYTSNRGMLELRKLISEFLKKQYGVWYDPEEEIIITAGVSQGLDLAFRSILNPGDEVIIFEPCYVSYPSTVCLSHGTPVVVPTYFNEEFRIDIRRVAKAITPSTKAILLNYPSNPTGTLIDPETMEQIAALSIDKNLIVLADEIYSTLCFEKKFCSMLTIPEMKERVIYLNGFSKSHAMTGWRLGYVAGPGYLMDQMLKIHQYVALCAPSMAQYAGIEALQNSQRDVQKMKSEYHKRRNYIVTRFNEIGLPCHYPGGAFYVFPDIRPTGLSCEEFALKLLKSEKVAVVPGSVFGTTGAGHIRCSFATSIHNIKEAMYRIERFIKSLE